MLKIIVTVLLVGALGGGYYYYRARKAAEAAKPQIVTAAVERGSIRLIVPANGRVVSNLDVDIKCKASGEIINLPFDVSATVKKDDLLLELDPVDEKRAVSQSEIDVASSAAKMVQAQQNLILAEATLKTEAAKADANLKSAEVRAQRAKVKADRLKTTFDQGFSTQEEYDEAAASALEAQAAADTARVRLDELKAQEVALELKRQDVKLAQTQVASDQINLANAQQRLKDTRVLSPMDGVVSARSVQKGMIISSAVTNVGGGSTVLTLSDLSQMFVLASVDESDIGKVELKQPVGITADAYAGMKFRGEVVRIATKGVTVSNVTTFEVKIEITSKNKSKLKPEMTTNLEIIVAQKDDALTLPVEAVTRKQGKQTVSLVLADGGREERVVETGINDGVRLELVSGLNEGDVVELGKGNADDKFRSNPARNQATNPARLMGVGGGGGGGPGR